MPQPIKTPQRIEEDVTDLYKRVAKLERRSQSSGGSFDPNEDPVIIGSGAGTSTSTPSSLDPADSGSVILGLNAFGPGIAIGNAASVGTVSGIAIGNSSNATTDGVAIGDTATVVHSEGIAIGLNAFTGSTSNGANIAIGSGATATKANSVAIGTGATTGFNTHSVALGAGATTTGSNQIMLGTSSDTIYVAGFIDGNCFPTTNPGAGSKRVWNNGGVLTVA